MISGYYLSKQNLRRYLQLFYYSAILGAVFLLLNQASHASSVEDVITSYQATHSPDSLDDTIIPYVGTSLFYNSNLLCLSESTQHAYGIPTKSDFIKQLNAGFNLNWDISRQKILVKADINQNWFNTFSSLDYLGHNAVAQWNWLVNNRLSGQIGYENITNMASYSLANNFINNLYTSATYFARGSYEILPSWFIRGAFQRNGIIYSTPARQSSNQNSDIAELSLQYLDTRHSTRQNMVGLSLFGAQVHFPNRLVSVSSGLDNAYTNYNYNLTWDWFYSTKTEIDGAIGYMQVNFADLAQYNFSGPTYRISFAWWPTGKTVILLSSGRYMQLWNSLTTSFLLTQVEQVTPRWIISPKTQLYMPIKYQKQSFLGPSGLSVSSNTAEIDQVFDAGLYLDYKAFENTKITLFFQYEKRNSNNNPARMYSYETLGMNMEIGF